MEEMLPPENPMGTAGAALAAVTGQWIGSFAGYFIKRRWNQEIPICFTIKADTGRMAAILTFLFPFSWFDIADDNTKAGGQLPEDEPDFRSSIELVWNPCFYKGNPDMKLCEKVEKGAGIR